MQTNWLLVRQTKKENQERRLKVFQIFCFASIKFRWNHSNMNSSSGKKFVDWKIGFRAGFLLYRHEFGFWYELQYWYRYCFRNVFYLG